MRKENSSLQGNAQFEGYIADLLERLATKAGFSYVIRLVADNKYGSQVHGRWIGMVGEVKDSVSTCSNSNYPA